MTAKDMPKIFRFGLVGSLGTIINFSVYWLFVTFTSLGINQSAIAAFGVAIINNYVLNHSWTFRKETEGRPINLYQFIKYVFGNISGLGINLIVLNVINTLMGFKFHFIGQLLGIASGMLFNFAVAKTIVFTRTEQRSKNRG